MDHILPYKPRGAFAQFHKRTKRWACLVAHRRAGKTVAAVNDLIRAALTSKSPMPQYAYIAPYRSQAKSVAWDYLKHYSGTAMASANEAELTVEMVNGAKIRLFGADNADAMRGLGFDGVYLDEFGDFKPSVWGNVVRPALSDRQGWCVFGGTPKGKNQFWEIRETAARLQDWFLLELPASKSGLLPDGELAAAKAQLSKDQYDQEYECSFEAAIMGAFYGQEMREATDQGRITAVAYDQAVPVHTAWDLGYRDDTAIWWYQVMRGEVHVIDYYAVSGANISEIASVVTSKPYSYGKHYLPHDARAKTLAAQGKSIIEQLAEHLGINNMAIVPDLSVQDGIQAARMMLPLTWFDAERCREGVEALRQYRREYDEDKKAFRQTPVHNWCLTGDTKVLTRYGMCQIMSLPYSGEVLTSCGWKRYINPRVTRKNASLVEVLFSGGYSVKCTPDHSFKTARGWISAECLSRGTPIQSALTLSRSISMAAYTAFGLAINIYLGAVKLSTGMRGVPRLALSRTGATYTTGTATQETMPFQTLSVSQQKYTFRRLWQGSQSAPLTSLPGTQQRHGTDQTRGGCGISVMPRGKNFGLKILGLKRLAPNVAHYLWRLSEKMGTPKRIALAFARSLHIALEALTRPRQLGIESVKRLSYQSDVWCLTVPGSEEFSLGNGAIVHNCSHPADAFRMLSIAWRAEPETKKPDSTRLLMVGEENQATLNDLWETSRTNRRIRL